MRVSVILYSYLRTRLPPEARGKVELDLPEGTSVNEVFQQLDLPPGIAWAVNGKLERDQTIQLNDGDELSAFRQGAGG